MKEKKKSSTTNQTNMFQERNFSQIEVNTLLEHYQKGRYDLAESLAKKLTQQDPNHQFSWMLLSALFKQTGRLHESLTAIQRVVAISPNDAEAYNNMGVILKELGRLEGAEASYKKALMLEPNLAQTHNNLGNIFKEFGRFEEAEASYKNAIVLSSFVIFSLTDLVYVVILMTASMCETLSNSPSGRGESLW
jgi:Flp pilus assembly protein TadD